MIIGILQHVWESQKMRKENKWPRRLRCNKSETSLICFLWNINITFLNLVQRGKSSYTSTHFSALFTAVAPLSSAHKFWLWQKVMIKQRILPSWGFRYKIPGWIIFEQAWILLIIFTVNKLLASLVPHALSINIAGVAKAAGGYLNHQKSGGKQRQDTGWTELAFFCTICFYFHLGDGRCSTQVATSRLRVSTAEGDASDGVCGWVCGEGVAPVLSCRGNWGWMDFVTCRWLWNNKVCSA